MSVYLLTPSDNEEGDSDSPTMCHSIVSEASQALVQFWPGAVQEIKQIQNLDPRCQTLPLARIKKIMKLDDDVKMISAEAPVLFAKAAELFIQELTLRSWVHTEDNKRRTLQRNDIAMAIAKYDQFDFLIDIVPREEAKPSVGPGKSSQYLSSDQVHYYFQLSQQAQQAAQQQQETVQIQQTTQPQPQAVQVVQAQPHVVQAEEVKPTINPSPNIQLVQQVVSPTGQIQHVPLQLTQNQIQMIRMQMNANPGQSVIIQPHVIQVTQPTTNATTVYLQTNAGTSAEN
ncbi:nuclear transcription factor Y subunit gamma-like [Rhodnius prolixus]|uniref:Nuclear transcription factor Y subunit gamma n=1 Tax=Rhodnius neglectus TaxID=72488 RepID=A0A0P4VZB0_9HEMI